MLGMACRVWRRRGLAESLFERVETLVLRRMHVEPSRQRSPQGS